MKGAKKFWKFQELETLSVYDRGASFVVFGFSDPHSLEGREGGENRTLNFIRKNDFFVKNISNSYIRN